MVNNVTPNRARLRTKIHRQETGANTAGTNVHIAQKTMKVKRETTDIHKDVVLLYC